MSPKPGTLARRALDACRRGSASFSAAALGLLLLVGAALGDGIPRTAVAVSDGLTWLNDDERGEVVQVNPSSGKPQARLQVSGADARLEIAQSDDELIVLDRRTGQVTVIDLATLLASGRRQAPPGPSAKVLIVSDGVVVVDRAAGSVHRTDPVTLADVGQPWFAGQPLADVVVDDEGVLWAVDHGGNLRALLWSDEDLAFAERSDRPVPGAGPRTALVPHERGVTLLGLEGGVVVRDGTGRDLTTGTASLVGEVPAAQTSPAGLVPASVPDAGAVVLLSGDRVVRVDMGRFTCPRPGRPAVFRERVYVPCLGAGKVVVLDRDGGRGSEDVRTGGSGDPALVFDDGRLFINTPGSDSGLIVDADGRTRGVVVRSPDLPVTDPDRTPIPSVPSPPPRPDPPRPDPPGRGDPRGGPRPPDPSTTTAPPTTTPSPAPQGTGPGRPAGVTVTQRGNDGAAVVLAVTWSPATEGGEPLSGYSVTATGAFSGGTRATRVTGTSAELSLPCAGTAFCTSGRVDVAVAAYDGTGAGEPATASWTVRPAAAPPPVPTTTTPPAPQPPAPQPPAPQPPAPTTTTTTTPPPPPPLPTPRASVITSVTGGIYAIRRTVTTGPPADWAGHAGRCEVVNTDYGYTAAIPCAGGSAPITVEFGANNVVVRAHAVDGSASVDSAARLVNLAERDPGCGNRGGCVPRGLPASEDDRLVGGGLGLLATAWLLRLRRRKTEDDE